MLIRISTITAATVTISSLFLSSLGSQLFQRDISVDVCGEVDAVLSVPNILFPGKSINIGSIKSCLCISTLPSFILTDVIAIAGIALSGKSNVLSELTKMVNECGGQQTCHYPSHSVPSCSSGSPCFFSCKDGYTASPSGKYPTACICEKPYIECNGKCGSYKACPSPHAKRDLHAGGRLQVCPQGMSACGILGRSAKSWECVDTHSDLESCGGCLLPLPASAIEPEGTDCTAIQGVSDVSCIRGSCVVHRCMPGYDVSRSGFSCVYSEDNDPVILAAEYGLEHIPL